MLFPTTIFAVFFATVYLIHWTLPERSTARKFALLAASIFFYGYWHWGFAGMMMISALINHLVAIRIESVGTESRRKWLIFAITANLLTLAFFKYTGFLYTQCFLPLAIPILTALDANDALLSFNERALPFIQNIVLPVGISFYTFQAIAYISDVASGKCKPAKSFIDFANYLAFFPKLAAGPIARPADLIPQMETMPPRSTPVNTGKAMILILAGLFKKTVVANWLSTHLADEFFQFPEDYGAIDAIIASYGYAIQIYCDFSAYSDIATGCAVLLGFTFPENFRAPYIATSFQDFWRRWHISLSSWLRDYLYIPLGGSHCAKWKIYRNLMLTMLLGGLWHGAGWVYIIWGAIHGIAQIIERPFNRKDTQSSLATKIFRAVITFHVVVFAWIFFRSGSSDTEGLATVREIFNAFTRTSLESQLLNAKSFIILLLGFSLQIFDGETLKPLHNALGRLNPVLLALIAAVLLTIILGLGPAGVAPFIYFQF